MSVVKSSICLILLFCSVILTKPYRRKLTTQPMPVIYKIRRQRSPPYLCDILYENCDSDEQDFSETKMNNEDTRAQEETTELQPNPEQIEMKKTNSEKLSVLDSLENLSNLDDNVFDVSAYYEDKAVTLKFDADVENRDHWYSKQTLSTKVWFYSHQTPELQKLPHHIMMCNDQSKCRFPFENVP